MSACETPPVFRMSQNRMSLGFVHGRVIFQHFPFFFFSLQEEQTVEGNLTHLLTLPHIRKKQKKPSASNLSEVWIIGGAASDHSCNFQTFTPTSRSDQASCEEVRKHPGSERLSSSLYL